MPEREREKERETWKDKECVIQPILKQDQRIVMDKFQALKDSKGWVARQISDFQVNFFVSIYLHCTMSVYLFIKVNSRVVYISTMSLYLFLIYLLTYLHQGKIYL